MRTRTCLFSQPTQKRQQAGELQTRARPIMQEALLPLAPAHGVRLLATAFLPFLNRREIHANQNLPLQPTNPKAPASGRTSDASATDHARSPPAPRASAWSAVACHRLFAVSEPA